MTIWLLVLTHNRLEQVQRCFESLAATLARPDVRCVVLDNASTDGTRDFITSIPLTDQFNLLVSDDNLGVAGGRYWLLRGANAGGLMPDDLVIFLDSDTVIVDDNWLDALAKAIEPENVGLVGPGGSFVLPGFTGFTAGIPGEVDVVAGYCQMFKAELLSMGVHIDTAYEKFWTEDSDFAMQIRDAGYDVLCVPVGVQHFPSHSGYGQDMTLHDKHIAMFRERWQGKSLVKTEGGY
jgi:glycosyltransferase involved in cell wall biosynthesis